MEFHRAARTFATTTAIGLGLYGASSLIDAASSRPAPTSSETLQPSPVYKIEPAPNILASSANPEQKFLDILTIAANRGLVTAKEPDCYIDLFLSVFKGADSDRQSLVGLSYAAWVKNNPSVVKTFRITDDNGNTSPEAQGQNPYRIIGFSEETCPTTDCLVTTIVIQKQPDASDSEFVSVNNQNEVKAQCNCGWHQPVTNHDTKKPVPTAPTAVLPTPTSIPSPRPTQPPYQVPAKAPNTGAPDDECANTVANGLPTGPDGKCIYNDIVNQN